MTFLSWTGAAGLSGLALLASGSFPPAAPGVHSIYLPYAAAPGFAYTVTARPLFDGEPDLVVADGDRAAVRLGHTIGIVDLAGGGPPRLVARSEQLLGGVQSLLLLGDHVYVGSGPEILALRYDPARGLALVGRLDVAFETTRLAGDGRHLVAWTNGRLLSFDRSEAGRPSNPRLVYQPGPFWPKTLNELAVGDGWVVWSTESLDPGRVHASALDGTTGSLEISPRQVTFDRPTGLAVWDHYALVGSSLAGSRADAYVVDLTAAVPGTVVGQVELDHYGFTVLDRRSHSVDLLLQKGAGSEETFVRLDVTEARQPRVVVRAGLPWPHTKPWGADAIAGDRLLRREDGTLATYRLAGVDSVVPDGGLRWRAWGELLAVQGQIGYFHGPCPDGAGRDCLLTIDLADPGEGLVGEPLALPDAPQSLTIAFPWAYLTLPADIGNDLRMLNLSDPRRPRLGPLCRLATGRRLAAGRELLAAFDLTPPAGMNLAQLPPGAELLRPGAGTCPVRLGSINDVPVNSLVLRGGFAVVATRAAGLRLFDLADPTRPKQIGLVDPLAGADPRFNDYFDLVLDGTAAVVATGAGLMLVDLRQLTAPAVLGFAADWCDSRQLVAADGLVLASCSQGIALVDVREPGAPKLVTRGTLRGSAVAGEGGRFYVSDASHDVWELRALPRPIGAAP
jgi:hypothetical protein